MVKLGFLTWESKTTASTKGGLGTEWFKCQENWHQHSITALLGPKLKLLFSVALGGGTTKITLMICSCSLQIPPIMTFFPSKVSQLLLHRISNDWFSKPSKNLAFDLLMESASSVDTAVLALCVGLVFRPRNCHFISVQDCLLCISHIAVFYVHVHIAVDVAFILDGKKIVLSSLCMCKQTLKIITS